MTVPMITMLSGIAVFYSYKWIDWVFPQNQEKIEMNFQLGMAALPNQLNWSNTIKRNEDNNRNKWKTTEAICLAFLLFWQTECAACVCVAVNSIICKGNSYWNKPASSTTNQLHSERSGRIFRFVVYLLNRQNKQTFCKMHHLAFQYKCVQNPKQRRRQCAVWNEVKRKEMQQHDVQNETEMVKLPFSPNSTVNLLFGVYGKMLHV